MNVLGRRQRQFKNGFKHLAKRGRPMYKSASGLSVAAAIERNRVKAAREQAAKGKKK